METTVGPKQQKFDKNGKAKHPKGLYLLFITEMWERYSYYGMRSVLVLYLTAQLISGGLGMDNQHAVLLYGYYTGAVYFTPLIGGYLTDKWITLRTAITIGGVIMALGDFSLFAIHAQWGVYFGLICLIIGNGFFKPNISTLVGELYEKNDVRKDSAFTIFYMGINLGALFSPLIAGLIYQEWFHGFSHGVEHFGFRYAFLASSIGMILGQVSFNVLGPKLLGNAGLKPAVDQAREKDEKNVSLEKKSVPLTPKEKRHTIGILVLAVFVIFFWAGYEQAGSSFTLYTKSFLDRDLGGFTVPVSWFQSLNPLFILILAPVISMIWIKLSKSKRGDFSVPTKMSFGLILLGIGFLVLLPAVMQTGSDEHHIVMKANMAFMVITYLFHTVGELCLSPVGLSLVSKFSPIKIASLLMGTWFLSNAAANMIAGKIAAMTQSLGYFELYLYIGIGAVVLGFVLLAVTKPIQKLLD